MKRKIINSLYVATGGAVGSLMRYIIAIYVPVGPYPTLLVNTIGSFLLGFITVIFVGKIKYEWIKLLAGTGFCGGFTTMSAFSFELTILPVHQAILYLSGTLISSLFLTAAGMNLAEKTRRLEEQHD